MNWNEQYRKIEEYRPVNEQEECDKARILRLVSRFSQNILLRENTLCH